MRKIRLIIIASIAFFAFSFSVRAKENNIVINEIQITGGAKKTAEDFIELYNSSNLVVDISGWKLRKKASSGGSYDSIKVFEKGLVIPAKGYFLWANINIKDALKSDESSSVTIAANNSVALFDSENNIIDQVGWGKNLGEPFVEKTIFPLNPEDNKSLERIIGINKQVQDTDDNSKDFVIQDTPSPTSGGCKADPWSEKCIIKKEELLPEVKKQYPAGIIITELFPNPFQSQYEEYVELYNGSLDSIDLKDWTLHDASKSGKYTFPASLIIETKKYLAIFKKDYKFALNNSGTESVTLFDPNGIEVAKAEYGGSKRNVSYNFDVARWRWSKFLTPGTENILNNEPFGKVKIDNDVFANAYAYFSVSTGDLDGDTVKVTWDFGDGRKSYLAKTKHKYLDAGIYSGSVKLSDGSEDVMKSFAVEAKDFPHPKIRIVAINANPSGKDTGVESIIVQNKTKKKINLNGWSIATGWKKFINHPIREDVIVKGKKEKEITSEFSSFTLNNTKAKIQLRYPDGKVAHEVRYESPNKSITEGEIYQKVKGGWEWAGGVESFVSSLSSGQKSIKSIEQKDLNILSSIINPPAGETGNLPLNVEIKEIEEIIMPIKIEMENKFVLLNNENVKIELLKSEPHVLGTKTVQEIDGVYLFTPQIEQQHYMVIFLKSIFYVLNLKLNTVVSYFLVQ